MSQDIHVTSTCITNVQRNLNEYLLPALKELKKDIGSTDVGFPGFGTLGAVMLGRYGDVQHNVRGRTEDAIETVEAWIEALETIKKNWIQAENNSTVVYR
ncbi:hypothetical protein [Microtetraspora sp. NBRC 16547]|uniref:hypothetical protein n=1 Tax=Microtetraspora sp. NBRC 16547 TaxID=3030993 RepID=UPI002555E1B6|nr:hypothetical protein [Microtetraspora sp. NBRC 16547]